MYTTNCNHCNGRLFLIEIHVTFTPGTVPVDALVGLNFGMDDIYDAPVEVATCSECGATYALNDLYRYEDSEELIWLHQPSDWLH